MSEGAQGTARSAVAISVLAGAVLGVAYTLSPLTFVSLALLPALVSFAGLGLPDHERRWLWRILLAAMALRLAVVGLMFLLGEHDAQAATLLTGDEAYALSRTLRVRSILLGVPLLKHDYVIAFEDYGRTSYLSVMTLLQVLAGPSPYGLRLINTLLFFSASLILFRVARRAYGMLPAFVLLTALVFLPTLFFWSIALLKEALYLALAAVVLGATYLVVQPPRGTSRVLPLLPALLALAAMKDLRQGAVYLVGGGAALGVVAWAASATRRRFAWSCIAALALIVLVWSTPPLATRIRSGLNQAAQFQVGHVFTVGHAYKTLDEGFYVESQPVLVLTDAEAARYVLRSIFSFAFVPLPWEMKTPSELAFLAEHILWYVSLPLAMIGFVAGLQRDRLLTWLLAGATLPTTLVVALTHGNVGTLIRFRGLVWPYILTLAALGALVGIRYLLSRHGVIVDLERYVQASGVARGVTSFCDAGIRAARRSRILDTCGRWIAPAFHAPRSTRIRLAGAGILAFALTHLLLIARAPTASAPAMPDAWWAAVTVMALSLIAAAGPLARAWDARWRSEPLTTV